MEFLAILSFTWLKSLTNGHATARWRDRFIEQGLEQRASVAVVACKNILVSQPGSQNLSF